MRRKVEGFKVIHPVWGEIRLNEKFSAVLDIPEFKELAFKSQLGTKIYSKKLLNANHTRLLHSIGVMYLTRLLLETCEKKFSAYFTITDREKEVLELAALGHDIGHAAFSHSLEATAKKTHEERTIEIFEKEAERLNEIFEYDITKEVIQVFRNNEKVKHGDIEINNNKLDILFIFTSLLIGTIDCDRIEYLTTDNYEVTGNMNNFLNIFNYITIVLLKDSPTVAFEKDAIPIIENLLISRFNQYVDFYYEDDAVLIEMAMSRLLNFQNIDEEKFEKLTEYEFHTILHHIIVDESKKGTIEQNLANAILYGDMRRFLFKKFNDTKSLTCFLSKLNAITKRKLYSRCTKKVELYNPAKNKVYIKDDDGVVKDIMDVSSKVQNYKLVTDYIMVNLDDLQNDTEEIRQMVIDLFKDNPVEIEKKFINTEISFSTEENDSKLERKIFNELLEKLGEKSSVKINEHEPKIVNNHDLYYNSANDALKGIAIRYRKPENAYYIKIPVDDGTSIIKREEHKFANCKDLNEFLELAKVLFNSRGINVGDKLQVEEDICICTNRYNTVIELGKSVIEIDLDFSKYSMNGNSFKAIMLEFELKEGDELALWCISQIAKKMGFEETSYSKLAYGKKLLNCESN